MPTFPPYPARLPRCLKEALSNNPVRSGVDFDLLEVSSFSVDRVPLGPDSVDSR
jgi:hypothetical protein